MLQTEFFRASCLPDTWNVCGVKLYALSCWHLRALEELGNMYAYDPASADHNDTVALLMLCSMTYEQGRKLMTQPRRLLRLTRKYHKRVARSDWEEIHAACVDYVETCKEMPEVFVPEKGGKTLGGPHVWHVVVHLMAHCGKSEVEAWNMPYTRARCYYAIWNEANGGGDIWGDRSRLQYRQAVDAANKDGDK